MACQLIKMWIFIRHTFFENTVAKTVNTVKEHTRYSSGKKTKITISDKLRILEMIENEEKFFLSSIF